MTWPFTEVIETLYRWCSLALSYMVAKARNLINRAPMTQAWRQLFPKTKAEGD